MQVTETLNEGLKREYAMVLTAKDLDDKVTEKLKEAQPGVELKGFRKGKVPLPLLKKQFGPKVMGEAMQEAVDGALAKHFEDSGDRPAAEPAIKMANEDWKEGDDVNINVSYEALPEVPEVDLKTITLERMVAKAADADVDEALGNLAQTVTDYEDRDEGAAAADGDQITMDFVGSVDGVEFDGGAGDDYPLVLGSNSFIPGFEEQLVGVKQGDEKDVTVTFPDPYQAEHLAGKEAVFKCTIKAVKAAIPGVIDDELAKKYGAEDLDGLKAQVRERLEAEYTGAARAVVKRSLLDQLDALVSFELPPSMVESEAKQIAHQLWHEDNPEVEGHDHPEIEATDEHNELASRRVRLGLLLADLGKRAEVEVTDAEMTQAIMNEARQYPGREREFFEFVQQNAGMQQQMRAPIFEEKVVDYVLEIASVTDKDVSKDDLQAAIEALDDE